MLLWEALLELLYPSKCVLCGKLLDGNETNLCSSCRRALQPFTGKAAKPALTSSVTVAYAYEDPLPAGTSTKPPRALAKTASMLCPVRTFSNV